LKDKDFDRISRPPVDWTDIERVAASGRASAIVGFTIFLVLVFGPIIYLFVK
jgi:hypothetical protein